MAAGRLLIPGWNRALDSEGNAIAARVSLFNTGTDVLASVFANEALSVPLANPVQSNSAGRFPAIWASDAATYDWSVEAPYGPPGSPFTGVGLTTALTADILIAEAAEAAADAAEVSAAAAEAALADALAIEASGDDAAAIAARAAKAANGSDFADLDAVLDNLTVTQTGDDAVARPASDKLRDIIDARDFGADPESDADQTVIIQAAVDALADREYAVLNIPRGVKWRSGPTVAGPGINWTNNYNITIRHFANDDVSVGSASQMGTGEQVDLVVHSSYNPDNLFGAYVAEKRLAGPVHPGLIVDARYNLNITGAAQGLAPDQSLINPIRASVGIDAGGRALHHITGRYFTTTRSRLTAVTYKTFYDTYTLTGVGSDAWASAPAIGDRVTASGGFVGFVRAITTTTLEVQVALAYVPLIGETMSDSNESGIGPISAVVWNGYREFTPLAQSPWTGFWSMNIAAGDAESVWTVGGDMRVRRPEDTGQIYDDVSWPGYVWEHNGGPTLGASARQVSGDSNKRVVMYDGPTEAATPRGMVGAVCASTAFNHTDLVPQLSAYNVLSVTNPGTGQYRVTTKRALANIRYTVNLALNKGLARASASTFYTVEYEIVSSSVIDVFVYLVDLTANTVTAANLPGSSYVSLAVLNGDI